MWCSNSRADTIREELGEAGGDRVSEQEADIGNLKKGRWCGDCQGQAEVEASRSPRAKSKNPETKSVVISGK